MGTQRSPSPLQKIRAKYVCVSLLNERHVALITFVRSLARMRTRVADEVGPIHTPFDGN